VTCITSLHPFDLIHTAALDEQVRANPAAPFNYDNYAEMFGPLIAEASGTPEP